MSAPGRITKVRLLSALFLASMVASIPGGSATPTVIDCAPSTIDECIRVVSVISTGTVSGTAEPVHGGCFSPSEPNVGGTHMVTGSLWIGADVTISMYCTEGFACAAPPIGAQRCEGGLRCIFELDGYVGGLNWDWDNVLKSYRIRFSGGVATFLRFYCDT